MKNRRAEQLFIFVAIVFVVLLSVQWEMVP